MVKKAKTKTKKRGVKPGTKRGRYRKVKGKEFTVAAVYGNTLKVGDKIIMSPPSIGGPADIPPLSTLCHQLDDAIVNLENRISAATAKINSLM